MKLSIWFYRMLLWLYPSEHSATYGGLMMQTFRDMAHEAQRRGGTAGLLQLWPGLLFDTVRAAYVEYRDMPNKPLGQAYSRRHVVVAMALPLGLIVYFFFGGEGGGILPIYLCLLIGGGAAIILRHFRLIPPTSPWNAYTAGVVLGIASLIGYFLLAMPAFGVYRLGLPAFWIAGTSATVYGLLVWVTSRLFKRRVWEYRFVAAILAVTSVFSYTALWGQPSPSNIEQWVSINYWWMQVVCTLLSAGVSVWLARRWGRAGLIAMMVGIGTQMIMVDPGYFTGQASRWIDLCVALFPLVICPAWWLAAKSRRAQVWGTGVLWSVFIIIIAFAPNIARTAFAVDFVTTGRWFYGVLMVLPYAVAMWLALREVGAEGFDAVSTEHSLDPAPDVG